MPTPVDRSLTTMFAGLAAVTLIVGFTSAVVLQAVRPGLGGDPPPPPQVLSPAPSTVATPPPTHEPTPTPTPRPTPTPDTAATIVASGLNSRQVLWTMQ
jgi:hypothetical protein